MATVYRSLIRPFLFRFPPERAHRITETALRVRPVWSLMRSADGVAQKNLEIDLAGVPLPNPIGLAAGFDKDCRMLTTLLDLGFGFVVGGTVTLDPRPGNRRPRMVREPAREALLNALGFPGRGLGAAERQLRKLSPAHRQRVWVSISGTEVEPILECQKRLAPLVAGLELNISSPNTAGLVVFQSPSRLGDLVAAMMEQKTKPLFVKLPRLEDRGALTELAQAGVEAGADGVVAANTLPVQDARLAVGKGGLSGRPLFGSTLEIVSQLRRALPSRVPIVGCGGIWDSADVRAVLEAGATAVQLYTALVYEGPRLPATICRELSARRP